MTQNAIAGLKACLGAERARDDIFTRELYSRDDTPEVCMPAVVLFPHSHEEVQAIVRLAGRHGLPLTARAAGSGNVGGALPVAGGAVVSFECMQEILEYAPQERLIRVQSGCITAEIDRIAAADGLSYPPDPGSSPYCRIAGNLAMNAGGPHAVKYGVTRDYVLALRAVTGRGETLDTGVRTSKGVVGYDLTRLLVGSEGTLALITEATLRLVPRAPERALLRAAYAQTRAACAAVNRVMQQAILPSAVEFMDAHALAAIRHMGAAASLPEAASALLMIEVDGAAETIASQLELMASALAGEGLLQLETGQDAASIAALWTARKALSPATKAMAPLKINEDVVVPVPKLCELLAVIDEIARTEHLQIVSFGHAGNGNLHVNLLVDPARDDEMRRAQRGLDRLFQTVLALGGTLSGEHGIGSVKRLFVARELDPVSLHLQKQIKSLFDPHGILNPGKLFPDD